MDLEDAVVGRSAGEGVKSECATVAGDSSLRRRPERSALEPEHGGRIRGVLCGIGARSRVAGGKGGAVPRAPPALDEPRPAPAAPPRPRPPLLGPPRSLAQRAGNG